MTVKKSSRLFLAILISFMVLPGFGQRLKGKVISYKETYHSFRESFGKIATGPKLKDSLFHDRLVTFDQKGNISEVVEYYFDGTVYCKFKGSSDYADNRMESLFARFDPEPVVEHKPFIIEAVRYGSGEMCDMSYRNDPEGRPVEETITDLMGNVIYTISFRRDEKGNLLEDEYSTGTIDRYKFDGKGNLTELSTQSPNVKPTITTFRYDESGNMIEMIVNNYFKSTFKFQYEERTYKYLFDKEGNWTERIEFGNGKPERILVRSIEYATQS
jgi:hypothetical protein